MNKEITIILYACVSAALLLTGCGKSSKTVENTSTSEIVETDNAQAVENQEQGTEGITSSFDASYEISLLTTGFWICQNDKTYYQFYDNGTYIYKGKDGSKISDGKFWFEGTEGNPRLVFSADTKEIYDVVFDSNTRLSMYQNGEFSEILENCSKEPITSRSTNAKYTVDFEEISDNVYCPVISGATDASIKDKIVNINSEMKKRIEKSMEDNTGYETYSISFETTKADENYCSITGTGSVMFTGAAHPNNFVMTFTIDMKKGEMVKLADLIDTEDAAEKIFNKENCYTVTPGVSMNDILYDYTSSDAIKEYLDKCDRFYIDDDGSICIYFDVIYALGSYTAVKMEA